MIKSGGELSGSHRAATARRQFDRKRNVIELGADRADCVEHRSLGNEVRPGFCCSFDKEPGTVGALVVASQRSDGHNLFACETKRDLTCGQDPRPAPEPNEPVAEGRNRVDEMLAVVDHQQCVATLEPVAQCVLGAAGRLATNAELINNRVGDERRLGQRCKPGDPYAAREVAIHTARTLQRKPSLADAADAGERHHGVASQRLRDLAEFGVAAQEAVARRNNVARHSVHPRRRKYFATELVQPSLTFEPAQLKGPERGKSLG